MTWDKKGLTELELIKQDINAEMENTTAWFKLSAAERLARYDMIKAIEMIEEQQATK